MLPPREFAIPAQFSMCDMRLDVVDLPFVPVMPMVLSRARPRKIFVADVSRGWACDGMTCSGIPGYLIMTSKSSSAISQSIPRMFPEVNF